MAKLCEEVGFDSCFTAEHPGIIDGYRRLKKIVGKAASPKRHLNKNPRGRFFHEHHHGSIGLMPPATVHYGHSGRVLEHRSHVLTDAFFRHPERFVHGTPKPPSMPEAVWINPPPKRTTRQDVPGATISTPDRLAHPPNCITYDLSAGPAILAGPEVRH